MLLLVKILLRYYLFNISVDILFLREKIAKLPPEVSEVKNLDNITSATQGKALLVQV